MFSVVWQSATAQGGAMYGHHGNTDTTYILTGEHVINICGSGILGYLANCLQIGQSL